MYEVINHTKSYAICQCEDGFYDTNGGFFPQLLNSQARFLNKIYHFEIEKSAEEIILHIFETETDITDNLIVFKETETGCQLFKDGKITITGLDTDTDTLFSNAKNPEVLLSFINLLVLKHEQDYPKLLDFFEYCYQLDEMKDISRIYISIYNMLLKEGNFILYTLIKQDMFNILICFLCWYKKKGETTLPNPRQLIKVLKEIEFLSATAYGPDKKSPSKIPSSVIDHAIQLVCQYGKENTTAFIQFMEVVRQLNEKKASSYERKDSLFLVCDSIELLVEIKRLFPDTQFSQNINYIIRQMFRTYEFSLTAEGAVEVMRTWRDYLRMIENGEPIYPDNVKKSHDLLQKTYQKHLSEKQTLLFNTAVEEYRDLEYQDKKFRVVVPVSSDELSEVGTALNICVGSYANAIAERKTQILWLYTDGIYPNVVLEVKNNELKQAKSKSNHVPFPLEEQYIEKWCQKKGIKSYFTRRKIWNV